MLSEPEKFQVWAAQVRVNLSVRLFCLGCPALVCVLDAGFRQEDILGLFQFLAA